MTAAAVAAQHARGVRVVDHHDGAVLLGQRGELVHRADVAVHGEDAVGDDELVARLVLDLLQQFLAVGDVLVAEDLDLGAREPRAVDDAGVVQLVGEDEVVFAEDGADGAGVGREAALKDDAGLDIFEARDLFFELHVDAHGAGDGAHGARAHAEGARGGQRGFNELGVVGQAEIVVAGEVDDLFAVVVADRGLLVVEHAQLEVGALGAEVVEHGGEIGKLRTRGKLRAGAVRHGKHQRIDVCAAGGLAGARAPQLPALSASISNGERWTKNCLDPRGLIGLVLLDCAAWRQRVTEWGGAASESTVSQHGRPVGRASSRSRVLRMATSRVPWCKVSMQGLDYALSKNEELSSANELKHVELSATVNGQAVM